MLQLTIDNSVVSNKPVTKVGNISDNNYGIWLIALQTKVNISTE